MFLVEKTESHIVIRARLVARVFLGGWLGLLHWSGSSSSRSSSGGNWSCQRGELLGIGDHFLDLLGLLEGVISLHGDGQQIPEGVGNHVRNGGGRGITNSEASHSDDGGALDEFGADILVGDIEDRRVKDGTTVVNLPYLQSVSERMNVQHSEERSFGSADFLILLDDVDFVEDFNRSSRNLRGDLQSLEERGLLWSESGALSWDEDVNWCQGAGLGGSWFLVAEQLVADLDQIGLGKDETHVVHNVGQNFLQSGVGVEMSSDGFAHHGVLAHQDFGRTTQSDTDLLHLIGADIVSTDDKELGKFIQKIEELEEIVGLPGRFVFPAHLEW